MQFNRLKRRELITLLGGAATAGTSPLAALARAFDKRPRPEREVNVNCPLAQRELASPEVAVGSS